MKTHDVIIGVDIGYSGAITFTDAESNEILSICDMPTHVVNEKKVIDVKKLKFLLERPKEHNELAVLVMEDVHAFPGQGSVSTGTLMEQKGILRGIAETLGYDVHLVNPKTWQKYFNLVAPKNVKGNSASQTKTLRKKWLKQKSIELARITFPSWALTKFDTPNCHGRSDSALISKWYIETQKDSPE